VRKRSDDEVTEVSHVSTYLKGKWRLAIEGSIIGVIMLESLLGSYCFNRNCLK